jgi:hypothetical protein
MARRYWCIWVATLYRGVIQERDIVRCTDGQVTFRYRDSGTGKNGRATGHQHAYGYGGGARSKTRQLYATALAMRVDTATNAACVSPCALPGHQHWPNF